MTKIYAFALFILGFIIALNSALFSVDQRQYALVFQFGEAIKTIEEPGLNIKIPFIQNVAFFDKRILHIEIEAKELTASDGKRIIIDAFAKFQITSPVQFYKTVHNYQAVKIRLNKIIESSMRKAIGRTPLLSLLTKERSGVIQKVLDQVNHEAENFGLKVIDVRILRADLPKENSNAIYKRMQTEREKEAKEIRAEGEEEGARIRSAADRESKIILANAYRDAQFIKGEGDALAMQIYNNTFSRDLDFYKLYKSLNIYRSSLKGENTSFVLSTSSEFFKYLNLDAKK